MPKKYTDSEAVKMIYDRLQILKRGESSFIGFAVGVALIIDPVPLSQADIDWAVQKAKELGFVAVEHTLAGGLAVRPANCDCDSWVVLGRHDDWCPANR